MVISAIKPISLRQSHTGNPSLQEDCQMPLVFSSIMRKNISVFTKVSSQSNYGVDNFTYIKVIPDSLGKIQDFYPWGIAMCIFAKKIKPVFP